MHFNTENQYSGWSNLAKVVYRRTYARSLEAPSKKENWVDTVKRVVAGNVKDVKVSPEETDLLHKFIFNRKALPGGRGLWMSGVESPLGGQAKVNCWAWSSDKFENFCHAMDNLMTGGGVGMSVQKEYVEQLPVLSKPLTIKHATGYDVDFVVPDNREGWCELVYRVLKAHFVTGRDFTYSTNGIRPYGEPIKGFGGTASGSRPLIECVEKINNILNEAAFRKLNPVEAGDILCCIGEMVVAGNVRRSALILIGDADDVEYLQAKNWSLGNIPNYRAFANFTVTARDFSELHPEYWQTFLNGEAYGLLNLKTIQNFGRIGEYKKDSAFLINPCGEIPLNNGEPCNLTDIQLQNIKSEKEFVCASRLMFRYMKRVTLEKYPNPISQKIISQNMRVGQGLTGCLANPELFTPTVLNSVYDEIQKENHKYSAELGVGESIRTTTIKPAGTGSKVADAMGYEGIHPAYSRYFIQRIRIAANDPLVPLLRNAGHHIEPVERFDGTLDHNTLVVDFYQQAPSGCPVADEDWDTWKQLEVVKKVQRHWADNSVSVTVYYKKEEIEKIKEWLKTNFNEIKTISFLCHSDHGFNQAPKESISAEAYDTLTKKIKPLDTDTLMGDNLLEGTECANGICPVR